MPELQDVFLTNNGVEVYVTNKALQLVLGAVNEIDVPQPLRTDSERRLMTNTYSETVLWDYTGAHPIRAAGEPNTGQAQVSLFGWDGAVLRRVLLEASGEQRNVLCGKDEGAVIDAFRTDPNRVPWQRNYPAYVQVDPVEVPAPEGVLWNPGAVATQLYEVEFMVVNNDAGAAAVTVSVGVDVGGAGALAAPEYWMFNEVIPYPGQSGWRGPFIIAGDDDVRGVASAANDASIHFRIRRVDLGA